MTHDEMITVIQAHKNGKFMQVKHVFDEIEDNWTDADSPKWNFEDLKYRIKPESRSLWLVRYQSGNIAGNFDDEYQAKTYCSSLIGATIHQYKEVLP